MSTHYPLLTKKGIGLVEILIGAGILAAIVGGVVGGFQYMVRASGETLRSAQAQILLEEGLEAMKVLRDDTWSNIAALTPGAWYGLSWNGSAWATTTAPVMIDGVFDRRVKVEHAYRDAEDELAESGEEDENMYKVTARVQWRASSGTTTRMLSTYVANLFE